MNTARPIPWMWIRGLIHAGMIWLAWQVTIWAFQIDPGFGLLIGGILACSIIYDFFRFSREWITEYRSRPFPEQVLRHVSQGAATMVLTVYAMRWLFPCINCVVYGPGRWVFAAMAGVPMLFGLMRFIAGAIDARWFAPRFLPIVISTVKTGVGAAILWRHWPPFFDFIRTDADTWQSMVTIAGLWLCITGLVRLIVVSAVIRLFGLLVSGIARLRRRLRREKAYGDAGYAGIDKTRKTLGK